MATIELLGVADDKWRSEASDLSLPADLRLSKPLGEPVVVIHHLSKCLRPANLADPDLTLLY